jgi:(2Fe-2S) ferredoxin
VTDRTDPKLYFRLHAFVCTNHRAPGHPRGSCGARGAEALRDHLKTAAKSRGLDDVRINSAGCLDRCGLAPVMVIYPEGVWYAFETIEDIDEILETHLVQGGRVERLILDRPDGSVMTA